MKALFSRVLSVTARFREGVYMYLMADARPWVIALSYSLLFFFLGAWKGTPDTKVGGGGKPTVTCMHRQLITI